MSEDRSVDGRHIARRLAAALTRSGDRRPGLAVVETGDGAPSPDGTFAVGVEHDGDRVADVYVQPTRVYAEFHRKPAVAAEAAGDAGLRVRPKAVRPPRALLFVESVEQVEPALDVFAAVREAVEDV